MANVTNYCSICNKGTKQHEVTIFCQTCKFFQHAKCLPLYTTADITYANNISNCWTCPPCLSNLFPFYALETQEDLNNHIHTRNHLDIQTLEAMLFNPFELNNDDDIIDDLDPDLNFYHDNINNITSTCKYLYPDALSTIARNWTQAANLSFLHVNARSLNRSFDHLNTLLNDINHHFTIIGITETWLREHNVDLFEIEGYSHEHVIRTNKTGGGSSIYISDKINYKIRQDLGHMDNDIEMLWLELEKTDLNSKKNCVVGVIYRRPGSAIADFNSLLNEKLNTITTEGKDIAYMGDFNIDLLKYDTHPQTADFLNINMTYSTLPLINKPTRVTQHSATLIDNIFTNILDPDESISCIMPVDLSDHFPICFLSRFHKNANLNHDDGSDSIKKRDLSKKNMINFWPAPSKYL